ncbi:MAG: hypothetical protein HZB38_08405 [Planctomycetes bacterium]|nr:hypothetical protein [Planctomycetota bacterium]
MKRAIRGGVFGVVPPAPARRVSQSIWEDIDMQRWKRNGLFAILAVAAASSPGFAQDADTLTEKGVISGTMEIDFKSRVSRDTSGELVENSPAKGVQDTYTFTFNVAKTTEFAGKIVRQPNLYSKTIRKVVQGAALGFDINLSLYNPKDLKQKKAVGKWVGNVPIDTASGAYDLAGGAKEERPLRFAIDTVGKAQGFVDQFGGRLVGKAEKKDSLAQYTFKRMVGTKEVAVTVKRSDPMRFDGIELAKGPVDTYPRTRVTGRLDYDYETGNWYTDGIVFKYALNGKDCEDKVTGSIKWVEDPNRKTNGKGHYEFNLRFNEEKNKAAGGEGAAFGNMSDEEAFFAVDNSIPCLTGSIDYVDLMSGETVTSSKVTYALDANKLTKQQVINFFKLWTLCVGPTNDE